jgi:hypothetical protein
VPTRSSSHPAASFEPEPGATPNPKDTVEADLRRAVCDGQIRLAAAQRAIARNWTAAARLVSTPSVVPAPAPSPEPAAPSSAPASPGGPARCRVIAAYSARYDDYDVYVRSNQPDTTVAVTVTGGHTATWHTNAMGYADVYFKAGGYVRGRRVTARVGAATCVVTL